MTPREELAELCNVYLQESYGKPAGISQMEANGFGQGICEYYMQIEELPQLDLYKKSARVIGVQIYSKFIQYFPEIEEARTPDYYRGFLRAVSFLILMEG